MAIRPTGPSARRRYPLIGVALLLWLAVIVIGAGSSADDSLLGVENIEVLWVIALGVMALIGLITLILLNPFGGEWVEPDRPRSRGSWLLLVAAIALLTWKPDLIPEFVQNIAAESEANQVDEAPDAVTDESADTVAQLSDLLLIAGLALAVAAIAFMLRPRPPELGDELDRAVSDAALEAELVVALEALTTELETGSDPRSAVIAAYALLESVLSDHGSTRARSETAAEHLRRSLKNLRVDAEPLVQLGELYEVARFSRRPISEADQHNALVALERTRAELASSA